MASKPHQWFKSYDHFTKRMNFAYWWSLIGKGLRLQPAQQACFYGMSTVFPESLNHSLPIA